MKLSTLVATRLSHIRNARLSRADMERQRLKKFHRLAAYVQEHSPYYREIIAERRIDVATCTPIDFPVLTKTELMRNFDLISTDPRITRAGVTDFLMRSKDPFDLYQDEFYVLHSSGSSGEVGISVFSKEDWTRGIAQGLRFNPLPLKKRRLAFFGVTSGHFAGVSFAISCRRPALKLFYTVETFGIDAPLARTVNGLNRFQPDILMGYSSALGMLAEYQKRGELNIHPKWIQGSGEVVRAADRTLVKEAFGVPPINVYSCTEHLIIGFGRPEFGGMYLLEDDLFFELLPDHILVTNLFNYTLPLIRYRMGDVLPEMPDPNPVFPFRKIKETFGRNEQIPFFQNAAGEMDFISPHAVNELLIRNVRRFQLVVKDKTSCLFRVCLEDGLSDAARRATLADTRTRLGELFGAKDMGNVDIAIEEVEELPVDPRTGKFHLIVPADAPEHTRAQE